jgi:hypothetical protein
MMENTQKMLNGISHFSHLFFEAPNHAGKTSAIYMALGDKRFSSGGFLRAVPMVANTSCFLLRAPHQ